VGEDQLKFHFSTCYGPVMDVHLRSDSDGTGFAFIIFEEAKIAEKVMTNNCHYKINDKEMYIKSYASDEDQKKIFVTPLSKTEKEEVLTSALTTIFEQFGELVRVDWPLDHGKGRRRAFLLYKNIQGAITATNKENYMQEVREID
jgi:RNA recognition motif-containing protein